MTTAKSTTTTTETAQRLSTTATTTTTTTSNPGATTMAQGEFFFHLFVFFFNTKQYLQLLWTYWSYGGGSKKAWNASFGPLVSVFLFFSSFFLHTNYVYIFIGLINVWRDWQEGMKKKMGPNDTFQVVWAISKFFFYYRFFLHILTILQIDPLPLQQTATLGRQQCHLRCRTNDRGTGKWWLGKGLETVVSWALGMFFYLFNELQ